MDFGTLMKNMLCAGYPVGKKDARYIVNYFNAIRFILLLEMIELLVKVV